MDLLRSRHRSIRKVLGRLISGSVLAVLIFCITGCGAADRAAEDAVVLSGIDAVNFTGFTIIENNNITQETESEEPEPEATWDDRYSQFTLDAEVKVYNKADLEASVLGSIPAGSAVRSLGAYADGTWSRISYNGRVAYINVYKEGVPAAAEQTTTADTDPNGGFTADDQTLTGVVIDMSSDKTLYKPEDDITVNITISAREQIGPYYIQMEYDTERMLYEEGADSETDGIMVFTGTGLEDTITYELHFKAAASGLGGIYISQTNIVSALEGTKLVPEYDPVFDILMSGNSSIDTFETMVENGKFISMTGLPVIGSIRDQNNDLLYVLNHFQMVPNVITWNYSLTGGVFKDIELAYITDQKGNIHILCMPDSDNNYHMYALGPDEKMYPVIKHTDKNGDIWYVSSAKACMEIPDNISRNEELTKYAVYAIDALGNGRTGYVDNDGNIQEIGPDAVQPWMFLIGIIIILFAGIIVLFGYMNRSKRNRKTSSDDGSVYVKETPDKPDEDSPEAGEVFMKTEQRPYSHEEIFEWTSNQGHKYLYVADVADEEQETTGNKEVIPRKKIEAIMAEDIE